MVSVGLGHVNCVKMLIKYGASINMVDEDLHPPLFRAVVNGNSEIVSLLVQVGASAAWQDRRGKTALHLAASMGHLNCLTTLVPTCHMDKVSLDTLLDGQQCSVLHWAAYNGNFFVCSF